MKKLIVLLFAILFSINTASAMEIIGKWKDMPIKVYVEDNKNAYLMKRCFGDWTTATSKLVTFDFVDDEDDAQIVVRFADTTYQKAVNSIGITYPDVDRNGYFRGARIEIAKYSPNEKIKMSNFQLVKVMRHEIGHAIGLEHTNEPNSIMNPVVDSCLTITKFDVNSIRAIYSKK